MILFDLVGEISDFVLPGVHPNWQAIMYLELVGSFYARIVLSFDEQSAVDAEQGAARRLVLKRFRKTAAEYQMMFCFNKLTDRRIGDFSGYMESQLRET